MSTILGSWEIVAPIAIGGMAEVFLARAAEGAQDRPPVVVKRMLPKLAETGEGVRMFLDEARLGMVLDHPSLIKVLDVGVSDRRPYMVQEYVDGPDLASALRASSSVGAIMPIEAAVYAVARAAEGLHAAHEAREPRTGEPLSLVHRDVSPHNLLVSRKGEVKVGDFGIAKTKTRAELTDDGAVRGKMAYMAPEHFDGRKLDRRVDVLALGVTLWEALVGFRLYRSMNAGELMAAILVEDPPAPSRMRQEIDGALDAIVARAVDRNRDLRTPSCLAFAQELDDWLKRSSFFDPQDELARFVDAHIAPDRTANDGTVTAWRVRTELSPSPMDEERTFVVDGMALPTLRYAGIAPDDV